MTRLLVSVRSTAEAETALRGGASVIDVKEPAHGSLGHASDSVIAEVVRTIAGARPVSAALGELADTFADPLPFCYKSLQYLKWGLSRCRDRTEKIWQNDLEMVQRHLEESQSKARVVAVAYADWQRAQSPMPEDVCTFAVTHSVGAFLIDTWRKDGSTLLDWLSLRELKSFAERCHAAGVPIALAGSLGAKEIRTLRPMCPDWFAVRGAVCKGRQREAAIDEGEVSRLAALLSKMGG